MTTRVITTDPERDALMAMIASRPLPITVEVVKGKRRSVEQNRLQRRLVNEIAEQTGQTAEEVRALCKLTIGVPILRHDSELFAEKYDRLIKPRSYVEKLEMMAEPIDFPVTRLMTTRQTTQYIDEIYRVFSEQGVQFSEKPPEPSTMADEPADEAGAEDDTIDPPSAATPPRLIAYAKDVLTLAGKAGSIDQRLGWLEKAQSRWGIELKSALTEAELKQAASVFKSAQAIAKDQADLDAAVSHYAGLLGVEEAEIMGAPDE